MFYNTPILTPSNPDLFLKQLFGKVAKVNGFEKSGDKGISIIHKTCSNRVPRYPKVSLK